MSATRLPHGYTNDTTRLGGVLTKRYQGPDAAGRQARETAVLRAVAGRLWQDRLAAAAAWAPSQPR
jgi:hypothetical protein